MRTMLLAVALSSLGLVSCFSPAPLLTTTRRVASLRSTSAPSTSRAGSIVMALNPPPRKKGFLRGLKESIRFIVDGDNMVKKYTEELGPVFTANIFFRPTVVIGGSKNVAEFLSKEQGISTSTLPGPLQVLMTDNNLLLQEGERHSNSKKNLSPMLEMEALKTYVPTIEKRVEEHIASVAAKGETALAKDFTNMCLALFAELFAGAVLTDEEKDLFVTYNAGLFSLTTFEPGFKKALAARKTLETNMMNRYLAAKADGSLQEDRYLAVRKLSEAKNLDGTTYSDWQVGYGVTQMIWGAYIETASLMSSTVIATMTRPEVRDRILTEATSSLDAGMKGGVSQWALPYSVGVIRECLRTMPPAGGGYRESSSDVQIAGYDIPVGVCVTADPRIGNQDASVFAEPAEFAPERWVQESDMQASKCPMSRLAAGATQLPMGAWFPGGTGKHKCPGVPLAELTAKIMLVKWVEKFGSWEEPSGPPDYIKVPIKIPKDSYMVKTTQRTA